MSDNDIAISVCCIPRIAPPWVQYDAYRIGYRYQFELSVSWLQELWYQISVWYVAVAQLTVIALLRQSVTESDGLSTVIRYRDISWYRYIVSYQLTVGFSIRRDGWQFDSVQLGTLSRFRIRVCARIWYRNGSDNDIMLLGLVDLDCQLTTGLLRFISLRETRISCCGISM